MSGSASENRMPRHVAIIMDGNGRWASRRGLPRSAGHKKGVDALRGAVRAAADFGVEYLTIYCFSAENWSRPPSEVTFLLDLLRRFIRIDVADLHREGVKITVIGDREGLDPSLVKLFEDAETLTRDNKRLTLVIAFNYGSRQEITRAAKAIAHKVAEGKIDPDDVTTAVLSNHLDTGGIPDPDLLIRTGGEQRLSNYLLWQCAYAEFVFVDEYWPDFTVEVFERAIVEYLGRDRRFGGIKVQTA
jgi:undecaprenyl diphosphate synthase